MKKKKMLILVIIILCIGLIVGLFITYENKKIFIDSYINYAWGYHDNGYIIYNNGVIKEYNKADKDKKLKKNKISKQELNKLKELANTVKDEFVLNDDWKMNDAGMSSSKVYNSTIKQWITLEMFGDNGKGKNNSQEAQEIMKLIKDLEKKYLRE